MDFVLSVTASSWPYSSVKNRGASTRRDFGDPQEWSELVGSCRFLLCPGKGSEALTTALGVEADVRSALHRESRGRLRRVPDALWAEARPPLHPDLCPKLRLCL